MNMNRMLNAFILIFFMVNIALYGYINHWKDVEYVISAEEMTLFKEIMDKNNVILYTTLPEFSPRPPLIIHSPVVQESDLLDKMFGDAPRETTFNNELDRHIHETDRERLTFDLGEDKDVFYAAQDPVYVPETFNEVGYDKLVKGFVTDFTLGLGEYELRDRRESTDRSSIIYYFNERYQEELLFCNEVLVKVVKEKGITEARSIRYMPYAFEETVSELQPIDEAFYSLLAQVDKDKSLLWDVTDIEVGYYLGPDDRNSLYNLTIEPHYRIKLRSGDTFLINAYTKDLVELGI